MLKSEIKAEELENAAKKELKNKNFEEAMRFFNEAKDIYLDLNYMGKVNVIDKQIAQLKRVIEYERRTGKNSEMETAKKPTKIYDNVKNIVKSEQKELVPKNIPNTPTEILNEAELRRERIRQQLELSEKQVQINNLSESKIRKREQKKIQEQQKIEEEKNIKQKQENENRLVLKNAEELLDRAKMSIKKKEFKQAKEFYKEAINIFKSLGWFDQVDVLYREIKNIETYKIEYLKKKQKQTIMQKKQEVHYQKNLDLLKDKNKKLEEIKTARLEKLSPAIKNIMQKAMMVKQKAEKEEKSGKIKSHVLERYEYVLELYKSIPTDQLDLTTEISGIERKIAELESRI
jgi:hypothetical protein